MSEVKQYNGILIDYSRDANIPEQGLAMLTRKGFYKKDHENSPQETFARTATCYSFGDYEFAQRIYDGISNSWGMFASPVMTNAVDISWPDFKEDQFEEAGEWLEENVTADGMPISCFLSAIKDTKESLVETRNEAAWLSMMGGGIGIHAGNRAPDEKSTGVMSHLRGYDADTLSYRQTESRRGSMAAYLDITHPEIIQFIEMRNPVGGDVNKKCFNLNNGVCIPDDFMHKVINGEEYELIDPKHGLTGKKISARYIWDKLLENRYESGEPFILFTDTVNRNIPDWIKHPLYKVIQSNLCTEITLMTSDTRTAVCCLSSLNLEKWDEIKDSSFIADMIRFLDNVLEYFIRLAPPELKKAVNSATKERALGLGTMGWHSYLQSKMIPFESGGFNSAVQNTHKIYGELKAQAIAESMRLGSLRGEAPDVQGSGMRNSHLLAIAPNASSSSLLGVSPSIEPWADNAFNAQGRAGSFTIRNKHLAKYLTELGLNTEEIWDSIIEKDGSIQHIEQIPDEVKRVFKTAREINQQWVIELAGIRQKYICQAQSVNLFLPNKFTKQEMSDLHILAWKKGVKSLYYSRAKRAKNISFGTGGKEPLNSVPVKVDFEVCLACEG